MPMVQPCADPQIPGGWLGGPRPDMFYHHGVPHGGVNTSGYSSPFGPWYPINIPPPPGFPGGAGCPQSLLPNQYEDGDNLPNSQGDLVFLSGRRVDVIAESSVHSSENRSTCSVDGHTDYCSKDVLPDLEIETLGLESLGECSDAPTCWREFLRDKLDGTLKLRQFLRDKLDGTLKLRHKLSVDAQSKDSEESMFEGENLGSTTDTICCPCPAVTQCPALPHAPPIACSPCSPTSSCQLDPPLVGGVRTVGEHIDTETSNSVPVPPCMDSVILSDGYMSDQRVSTNPNKSIPQNCVSVDPGSTPQSQMSTPSNQGSILSSQTSSLTDHGGTLPCHKSISCPARGDNPNDSQGGPIPAGSPPALNPGTPGCNLTVENQSPRSTNSDVNRTTYQLGFNLSHYRSFPNYFGDPLDDLHSLFDHVGEDSRFYDSDDTQSSDEASVVGAQDGRVFLSFMQIVSAPPPSLSQCSDYSLSSPHLAPDARESMCAGIVDSVSVAQGPFEPSDSCRSDCSDPTDQGSSSHGQSCSLASTEDTPSDLEPSPGLVLDNTSDSCDLGGPLESCVSVVPGPIDPIPMEHPLIPDPARLENDSARARSSDSDGESCAESESCHLQSKQFGLAPVINRCSTLKICNDCPVAITSFKVSAASLPTSAPSSVSDNPASTPALSLNNDPTPTCVRPLVSYEIDSDDSSECGRLDCETLDLGSDTSVSCWWDYPSVGREKIEMNDEGTESSFSDELLVSDLCGPYCTNEHIVNEWLEHSFPSSDDSDSDLREPKSTRDVPHDPDIPPLVGIVPVPTLKAIPIVNYSILKPQACPLPPDHSVDGSDTSVSDTCVSELCAPADIDNVSANSGSTSLDLSGAISETEVDPSTIPGTPCDSQSVPDPGTPLVNQIYPGAPTSESTIGNTHSDVIVIESTHSNEPIIGNTHTDASKIGNTPNTGTPLRSPRWGLLVLTRVKHDTPQSPHLKDVPSGGDSMTIRELFEMSRADPSQQLFQQLSLDWPNYDHTQMHDRMRDVYALLHQSTPPVTQNTLGNPENTPSQNGVPMANQSAPIIAPYQPISNQGAPTSNQGAPTSNQGTPTSNQSSPSGNDSGPPNHEGTSPSHDRAATPSLGSPRKCRVAPTIVDSASTCGQGAPTIAGVVPVKCAPAAARSIDAPSTPPVTLSTPMVTHSAPPVTQSTLTVDQSTPTVDQSTPTVASRNSPVSLIMPTIVQSTPMGTNGAPPCILRTPIFAPSVYPAAQTRGSPEVVPIIALNIPTANDSIPAVVEGTPTVRSSNQSAPPDLPCTPTTSTDSAADTSTATSTRASSQDTVTLDLSDPFTGYPMSVDKSVAVSQPPVGIPERGIPFDPGGVIDLIAV